ncbi:MAG: hypothetical protein R6U96_19110, partial [Promethearchaeia archaeon]
MNAYLIFISIILFLLLSITITIQRDFNDTTSIITKYITYPEELDYKCMTCGEQVEFCYPSGGHTYTGFFEKIREIRKFYRCTNPECPLFDKPLNPAPPDVLPFKRFSLAVWKWIAKEAKIYGQKPEQICERIRGDFGVEISEGTIRNYINEIDVYLSNQIDKRTRKILKNQGQIILAMDGQKPDDKGRALWLFVDLLSNRVVKICLLDTADHLTLHSIVEEILSTFKVELTGLVSDKQNSIVKMRDTFYPKVPHQYCHFHFLQNLWNHIEVKDGNLHKELKKTVNNLYILSVSKSVKIQFEGLGKAAIRDVFQEVEHTLRSLIKVQTRKFKRLRGIEVFENLSNYVSEMEEALSKEKKGRKVVDLMEKTATSLREALDRLEGQYKDCLELTELFQTIRKELGKEPAQNNRAATNLSKVKEAKRDALDTQFADIWEDVKGKCGITQKSQLKSFQPHKDTPKEKIKQEWVRLYTSYRRGLFSYYDWPISAKTNSPMEGKFSREKSLFISRIGKQRVGSQIRIRGAPVLKQLYVGKTEVKEHVKRLGHDYDRNELKSGLEALARRTHEETRLWKDKIDTTSSLESVLSIGKKAQNTK